LSDDETLKYLKQKDFNVNGVDQVGHSPFTMAAYHQKLKTLK
jgi:ankyrin repeat protein